MKIILCTFLVFASHLLGVAQSGIDSIRMQLESTDDPEERMMLLSELSSYYLTKFPDTASIIAEELYVLADQQEFESFKYNAARDITLIRLSNAEYNYALKKGLEALKIAESLNENKKIGEASINVADCYLHLGNFNKAEKFYQQALDNFQLAGYPNGSSDVYSGFGSVAYKRGSPQEAKALYRSALSYADSTDKIKIADIKNKLAGVLCDLDSTGMAVRLYNEALNAFVAAESYTNQSEVYFNLGELYMRIDEPDLAIENYTKCLHIAEHTGAEADLQWSFLGLSNAYESVHQYNKALDYHQKFHQLRDSIQDARHALEVAELEVQYASEKKTQEIESLGGELMEKQDQLSATSNLNTLLWVGVGILLVIIVLGYYIFLLNRKSNQRMREQQHQIIEKNTEVRRALKEKEVLLKEIHHRVKNNLQIISSLLNLQSNSVDDERAINVIREGQERIRAIALIHQKLYQNKNLAFINFQDYITDLVGQQGAAFRSNGIPVNYHVATNGVSLNLDTAVPLGLIISELISNANKHAFNGQEDKEINIELSPAERKGLYRLKVSDNGVGMPDDYDPENTESLGLEIVKSLTEQLDGEMEIGNKEGAVFTILFNEQEMPEQSSQARTLS